MSSTLLRRAATATLVVLFLLLTLALPASPAAAAAGKITGKVGDSVTGQPISNVDVYLGIPGCCVWAHTAADGSFTIDLDAIAAQDHGLWQIVFVMAPGTSHSNDPNDTVKNPSLPDNAQFSVVVQSFGSKIVGVVNEHQNVLDPVRAEALSYDGFTTGANTVYLPNITRKFFGLFDTPFIIQNLGSSTASVTSSFKSFDGTGPTIVIPRTIDPGRAKPIDPDSDDIALGAPGLTDNKQYAVTVSSNQPIAVVVNTQADKPTVAQPVAWSTDGVTTGAPTLYGAYAAKNAQGIGRYSPIIVQNLGAAAVTPKITFTPLTGSPGTANTYTFPAINPNSSKPFDPRFSFSTQGTTNAPCSGGGADCPAEGEYSIKIEAVGGTIAAQINVASPATP